MPRRHPPEVRRQMVELARSGTKVAALVEVSASAKRRSKTGSSRTGSIAANSSG